MSSPKAVYAKTPMRLEEDAQSLFDACVDFWRGKKKLAGAKGRLTKSAFIREIAPRIQSMILGTNGNGNH